MKQSTSKGWREKLYIIIYESNTKAGKAFDVALLVLIILSIIIVMLDSMEEWHRRFGRIFFVMEWVFTILFSIEYILRLLCIRRPLAYAGSFMGIIDLLAILPTYISIFITGTQSLLVVRSLRILRVFRIFKLTHFLKEMQFLGSAVKGSLKKISIFMLIVLTVVVILGSIMYLVEGPNNGYTNIPTSIYWAIVTITTVGYGDISPVTPLGKFIATCIMFIGYSIIAVPTGIVTTEMTMKAKQEARRPRNCRACGRDGHDSNALFCKWCGNELS